MEAIRLSGERLAMAVDYWIKLPYALQLHNILRCAQENAWDPDTLLPEIRHWMTQISTEEQKTQWGSSLYGLDPAISDLDGDKAMKVIEFAWLTQPIK